MPSSQSQLKPLSSLTTFSAAPTLGRQLDPWGASGVWLLLVWVPLEEEGVLPPGPPRPTDLVEVARLAGGDEEGVEEAGVVMVAMVGPALLRHLHESLGGLSKPKPIGVAIPVSTQAHLYTHTKDRTTEVPSLENQWTTVEWLVDGWMEKKGREGNGVICWSTLEYSAQTLGSNILR